jgi:hypothetical protein
MFSNSVIITYCIYFYNQEDGTMKKLLAVVTIGLAVLLLLSFMPSNTLDTLVIDENEESYLTLVPAVPAKPPKK